MFSLECSYQFGHRCFIRRKLGGCCQIIWSWRSYQRQLQALACQNLKVLHYLCRCFAKSTPTLTLWIRQEPFERIVLLFVVNHSGKCSGSNGWYGGQVFRETLQICLTVRRSPANNQVGIQREWNWLWPWSTIGVAGALRFVQFSSPFPCNSCDYEWARSVQFPHLLSPNNCHLISMLVTERLRSSQACLCNVSTSAKEDCLWPCQILSDEKNTWENLHPVWLTGCIKYCYHTHQLLNCVLEIVFGSTPHLTSSRGCLVGAAGSGCPSATTKTSMWQVHWLVLSSLQCGQEPLGLGNSTSSLPLCIRPSHFYGKRLPGVLRAPRRSSLEVQWRHIHTCLVQKACQSLKRGNKGGSRLFGDTRALSFPFRRSGSVTASHQKLRKN